MSCGPRCERAISPFSEISKVPDRLSTNVIPKRVVPGEFGADFTRLDGARRNYTCFYRVMISSLHYQLPRSLSSLPSSKLKCREVICRIIDRRTRHGRKDLILLHAPLRVIDSIDPGLRLDDKAAVLVHNTRGT